MKKNLQLVVVCALAMYAAVAVAGEREWKFTSIDVPKATFTFAYGIGPSGDIVGVYRDALNRQHGFLLSKGEFTQIDVPGAAQTDARGIAPDGTIVGVFRYPGEPGLVARGYLRTPDGTFQPANYPGHISTIPQRILSDGTILGCYHDNDIMNSMRGVTMAPSGNSELELWASMTNGSTPGGKLMAGLYTEMETMKQRGFIVVDGEASGFDYPGALATQAWDVNVRGAIVGTYADAAGVTRGFLWDKGEFTSINFPGARATTVFGINARGDLVGRYIDTSGRFHGFLATRTAKHNQDE